MLEPGRNMSRRTAEALLKGRPGGAEGRSAPSDRSAEPQRRSQRRVRPTRSSPSLEALAPLGWRDLARLVNDPRSHPRLRASAEARLAEAIETLTQGERRSLARLATRALIPRLLRVRDARVMAAVLGNPRLIEADVLAIAGDAGTQPACLSQIARCALWSARRGVKMALALNPACPPADALRSLVGMHAHDLERVAQDPSASPLARTGAARRLIGDREDP